MQSGAPASIVNTVKLKPQVTFWSSCNISDLICIASKLVRYVSSDLHGIQTELHGIQNALRSIQDNRRIALLLMYIMHRLKDAPRATLHYLICGQNKQTYLRNGILRSLRYVHCTAD